MQQRYVRVSGLYARTECICMYVIEREVLRGYVNYVTDVTVCGIVWCMGFNIKWQCKKYDSVIEINGIYV